MPDNFTGSFLINVQNAANPTLGQNGQGVCGVVLNFEHEYVGDLRITLTSPSGQTITLIGPIGLFGSTDGSTWNISFVPCADAPAPDPTFSGVWSNNQPWGLNGNYTGSYHPATGCLENFNTGPVNGTWTLTVTDGQPADMGNFYDYQIIFCDPTSITCFSCDANAGALTQADVVNCEGNTALNLNLPPTWTPTSEQPPANLYSYTYAISGPGGVVLAYDADADLSTYPPGAYTVCGVSYLTSQEADLPQPNGTLTITQLRALLAGATAPLCAKVTTNCVGVTIQPAPEDIEETVEICGSGCYTFFGQNYCNTGTYVRELTQNGCPYNATLNLTVLPNTNATVSETICAGTCSANPNFPDACDAGPYQVKIPNSAGCDSTINLILNVISATANIANNPLLPCGGIIATLQGTGSTVGGVVYEWTASNGGNIIGPRNLINANINAPGDYQLKVCRIVGSVSCCDSAQVTVVADTNAPAMPLPISGNITPCTGVPLNYAIVPVATANSYTWTFPAGTIINSGGGLQFNNVTWPAGSTGGQVCVVANNNCGPSEPSCITVAPVSITQAPIPQGPASVCNSTSSTYTVPVVSGATAYNWTVAAPATIASGQGSNTIVVNWNGATTANICLTVNNNCGTSFESCLPVTIGTPPTAPLINGAQSGCTNQTNTYTVDAVTGATMYDWVVTGGTITGGNDSTQVVVSWQPGQISGTVCVNVANACGNGNQSCINVALTDAPVLPVVSGDNNICTGQSTAYSIAPVTGASGYVWVVPSGAVITSGQNTTNISVLFPPGTASGDICVQAQGSCGNSELACLSINIREQPIANAGADQSVCDDALTLAATASIGTGVWSQLSGTGTAIIQSPSIPLTAVQSNVAGTYSFVWQLDNQGCSDRDTVVVEFNQNPEVGNITPQCDGANENYTLSFNITQGAAPFMVNNGSIVNNTFTSNPIPNNTPYSFMITDANGCKSDSINGIFNCNCGTSAGTMSLTALKACDNLTVTAQHNANAVLDANDVGAYYLHEGSGTILVNPLANNTTGVFGFQNGMIFGQTYYISYVVGNNVAGLPAANDPCRSVAQGQPCVFYQSPVADAGPDQAVCGLGLTLAANNPGLPGTWSIGTTVSGANLSIVSPILASSAVQTDQYGLYTLVWIADNNGCADTDSVQIRFNQAAVAGQISTVCNNTNTAYTVSFPITGNAPYSINGTAIPGNTFTSAPILSGVGYSFELSDANNCLSPVLAGSFDCNCSSDAGNMILTALSACEGESVGAQHVQGSAVLDGDDTYIYVLHEGAANTLLNPIASNQTGVFSWQSGMVAGQQYYISYVVGNTLNGSVDLSDNCLSVAQGQPVVFYPIPVANAGADQVVCGQNIALAASGSGTWEVSNAPAGGTLTFSDPNMANAAVLANEYGNYSLNWIVTGNGCTDTATVQCRFNPLPMVSNLVRDCDNSNENYQVSLTLTGGTLPYTVNGQTLADSVFVSAFLANGQNYSLDVSDANGCVVPTIVGSFSCVCSTNAGTMALAQLRVCESDSATATANPDLVSDANDVVAYILHDSAGPLAGTIFAQNTTGTFSLMPGMSPGVTYYISRVIGNPSGGLPTPSDPCYSVAAGQPVVFLQQPVANAGADIEVCGTMAQLNAISSSFSGMWSLTVANTGFNIADSSDPNSNVNANTAGMYQLRWILNNEICSDTDEVSLVFNPLPSIISVAEACNAVNTQYAVSIEVGNGTAPYSISGLTGTFAGATFTSALINSGSNYTFSVTDAKGCITGPVSGTKNCNCSTNAGSMNTSLLRLCEDQLATALWNNNATLDGDDTLVYVLHNAAGSSLGTIFDISALPQFAFNNNLQHNTTYYISAVAGSVLFGLLDLDDDCLSVANGTPVRWKPLPTVTLAGDTTICTGSSAELIFAGTGSFPLTVSYTNGFGAPLVIQINGPQNVINEVIPLQTSNFTILSVQDSGLPACANTLSDSALVVVNTAAEAGTAPLTLNICAEAEVAIELQPLLLNADPGGTWLEVSDNPALAGTFDPVNAIFLSAGQQPGIYKFRYKVESALPCAADEVVISVHILSQPAAFAGEDVAINCTQLEVELGESATTSGAGITYTWTLDSVIVGTDKLLKTSMAGNYILMARDSNGCTASDEVLVSLDNDVPVVDSLVLNDIRCFGEENGIVYIVSVSGGTGPYSYSLNGSVFTTFPMFDGLDAGAYSLEILDANGCSNLLDSLLIREPEQVLVELSADQTAILLGDTLYVQAQTNIPDGQVGGITWTPLRDTLHKDDLIQTFVPLHTDRIGVQVQDENGCTAENRLVYQVNTRRRVFVPNIFTPSSSENNVVTVYGGADVEKVVQFQIFDRWGEEVFAAFDFQPNDPTKSWKGTQRGKLSPPGVYVWKTYILFVDGKKELFSGDVTLFR